MPSQTTIDQQKSLLESHRRTLAIYLERAALQGPANLAPEVVHGIRDARASIAQAKATLRSWGEQVDDLPDDVQIGGSRWPGLSRRSLLGGAGGTVIVILAVIAAVLALRGPTNSNNGTGNVINPGTIGELTINVGDSPEVRQQKMAQAKRLVVNDTLTNIASVDARLVFVEGALKPAADPLATLRQTVAPASQAAAEAGYQQLVAVERAGALQQSLNSRPLRLEFGAPLVQILIDSGADASSVRAFYDELVATNDATESLMSTLTAAARSSGGQTDRAYWVAKIALERDTLRNRSQTAYLFGQLALRDMGATDSDAEALNGLQELQPRQLAASAEVKALLEGSIQEAMALTERRRALIALEKGNVGTAVAAYTTITEQLTIQPTDTQEDVVKKARSLRELGRLDEAVAAFARYGEMFSADPTTAQYAQVAQAFTRQIGELGVGGGAYIYGIAEGSTAQVAGLAVGDILVAYNGQPVIDADEAVQAIQSAPAGGEVLVEWLRLDPSGRLVRQQTHVPAGKLGVAMMLI